jgi:uracil-DNA glycosylase
VSPARSGFEVPGRCPSTSPSSDPPPNTPRALQVPWLEEFRRVLLPGGHALLSVHGASRSRQLGVAERARFERGELVVVAERHARTNLCGTFHPEAYIRRELAAVMPLLAHLPEAARDARQDLLLFRKD